MFTERIKLALVRDLRVQFLLLPLLALVCAWLVNAFAAPSHRVSWLGRPAATVQTVVPPATPVQQPVVSSAIAEPSKVPIKQPVAMKQESPKVEAPNHAELLMEAQRRFPPSSEQMAREISSDEAMEAWRLQVPFLDARRSAEYASGHVKGAWSLPVWETDLHEQLLRFDASGHPMKAPVVIYCDGGDCLDSSQLATKLYALGYRCLLIYKEGYPDWAAKQRPLSQGAKP